MLKRDFNKVALQFSCKFAAYFQNIFLYEHQQRAASVQVSFDDMLKNYKNICNTHLNIRIFKY